MKRIRQRAVIRIAKQRAMLETSMAKSMYRVFNSGKWRMRLQDFAGIAIEQLVMMGKMKTVDKTKLNAVVVKQGDLAVWKERGASPGLQGLETLVRNKRSWSAGDCSDLIRLFGEVIENKGLLETGDLGKDVDALKAGKRKFKNDHWKETRDRDRGGYFATVGARHIATGRHAMLRFRRQGVGSFAGIGITRLGDRSTVKKIDMAFALPEGCDISGTTADSIFFVDRVKDFCGPALAAEGKTITDAFVRTAQLLPMATMVSQAHHTVLECGLSLTLNGYVSYKIGFYSSLVPHDQHEDGMDEILRRYESKASQEQLHVLCFYERKRLHAYRMETLKEMNAFKNAVAPIDGKRLNQWKVQPLYLPESTAKAYLRLAGLDAE